MSAYNEYEERLIDRIAIREVAARLTPRDRRVICRYYRCGDTYAEIGVREHISTERVWQIERRAIDRMRERVRRVAKPPMPMPLQMAVPLDEFDRAAFLAHMQRLIEMRDRGQFAEFESERRGLAEMLANERRKRDESAQWTAKNKASPSLKIKLPVQYTTGDQAPLTWGIPSKPPPPDGARLLAIAKLALDTFLADRPPQIGLAVLGQKGSRVVYPHDGGQCEVAVQHLRAEVPPDVHLSALPFEVPTGIRGAVASNVHGALRAMLSPDGAMIFLDVSWDAA
jgi:DNA-binding CsgD family transcriptional regulator